MADENSKPACKYGENCYQKNETHINRFSHPPKGETSNNVVDDTNKHENTHAPTDKRARKASTSPTQTERNGKFRREMSPDSSKTTSTRSSSKSPKKETLRRRSTHSPSKKTDATTKCDTESHSVAATARTNHGPDRKHDIEFINDMYDKDTRYSQRSEYKELLKSPEEFIRSKFLVDMPTDFYLLWEFCQLNVKKDEKPECIFDKFGLNLIGPFDVLAGKFEAADLFEPGDYLRHWRFYYDPPEFQSILKKEKSGIHYGYWRDEPHGDCLVARNDVLKGCEMEFIADNIVSAVIYFIEKDAQLTPFNRPAAAAMKKSLEDFARQKKISLDSFSAKLKSRNMQTVCKTFHKAGLIVPLNRKSDVGYRQLSESDANLKKILDRFHEANGDREVISEAIDKLQPLITAANIAVDEGDFGNSIELGIDLFCHGAPELHGILIQLLVNGYSMVNKPQSIAIVKAHLEQRSKGTNLSIL